MEFVSENDNTFDLSAFDENIEDTEAADPFATLPNGNYTCKIEKIYMGKSANDNDMLRWEFRIVSGPSAGQPVFNNSMLMSEKNMKCLKNELVEICGLKLSGSWAKMFKPWTDNEKQPEELAELLDMHVQVSVKNRPDNDYPNVRLLKRVEAPAEDTDTSF